MSLLQMSNICKSFSRVPVLKNVQLTVEKGEVHALLGENGAGNAYERFDGCISSR